MRSAIRTRGSTGPVATKFAIPAVRSSLVRREHLLERLHQHIDRRCTVVAAPAGYGKSALLTLFANDVELPVCWLSVDSLDHDHRTFVQDLILAVVHRFPSACRRSQLLIAANGHEVAPEHLLGTFLSEIAIDIAEYIVLVVDDLHTIDDDRSLAPLLDLLISRLPENCHLVLASRSLPSLPALRKLIVTGEAHVLRSNALRFSEQEVSEVVRLATGRRLQPDEARRLTEMTDGWVTAVLLHAQLDGQATPDDLHTQREVLYQLLADEVWARQAPDVQNLLLQTSVLPRLSPEWCDPLIGEPTGRRLAELAERNALVFPLDENGTWYYCHQTFREFLIEKLRTEHPDRYTQLNLRAGELAEERDLPELALGYYDAARAFERAADVLERVDAEWFESGYWRRLQHWIDRLPASLIERRPWLRFTRARVAAMLGDLRVAERALLDALAAFEASGSVEGQVRCLCQLSMVARLSGASDRACELAKHAQAILPPEGNVDLRAEVERHLALSLSAQGHSHEAIKVAESVLELLQGSAHSYDVAVIHDCLGYDLMRVGRLNDALIHLIAARQYWLTTGNEPALALTLNNLGVAHLYLANYAEAIQHFEEAVAIAHSGGAKRVEACARLGIGDLRRDAGDFDAADSEYREALRIATETHEATFIGYARAALLSLAQLRGDAAQAQALSAEVLTEAIGKKQPYERGVARLAIGLFQFERLGPAAERHLVEAAAAFAEGGALVEHARASFHLARWYWKHDDAERCQAILDQVDKTLHDLGYSGFLAPEATRDDAFFRYLRRVANTPGLRTLLSSVERFRAFVQQHASSNASVAQRTASLEVFALGRASVRKDGDEIPAADWKRSKSKELFFFLMSRTGWVSEDTICDALWPEVLPGKVHSRFHSCLYQLRRTLGESSLVRDGRHYRINPDLPIWYDVDEFERLLQSETSDHDRLRRAVDLYRGPYFQECYSDWCESLRASLDQRYLQALCALGEDAERAGDFQQAISLYERALTVDEWLEELHARLMRCYLAAGQGINALKHYRRLLSRYRAEGLNGPSPEIRQIARSARSSLRVQLDNAV